MTIVTDTCTYITPIIERAATPVVTNSGKWAWYAPGNLGFDVAFATLEECVDSAEAGRLVRDRTVVGRCLSLPRIRIAGPRARRGHGRGARARRAAQLLGRARPRDRQLIDTHHPQVGRDRSPGGCS